MILLSSGFASIFMIVAMVAIIAILCRVFSWYGDNVYPRLKRRFGPLGAFLISLWLFNIFFGGNNRNNDDNWDE